jgi:hypothetical protein
LETPKDGLAYIGALPSFPRAYFAVGFGGNGIGGQHGVVKMKRQLVNCFSFVNGFCHARGIVRRPIGLHATRANRQKVSAVLTGGQSYSAALPQPRLRGLFPLPIHFVTTFLKLNCFLNKRSTVGRHFSG